MDELKNKQTYLVTGGAGFIGSHLVEKLLIAGHNVINVDNFHDFYSYKTKIRNVLDSTANPVNQFRLSGDKEKDIEKLIHHVNKAPNYTLYYTDIRDIQSLENIFSSEKIDMVIHMAALAGVRPSIERPIEYEDVNIKGTMNLWELCKTNQIKKFICASSSSVYGNNKKTPFTETDVVDGAISPYAATKKAGEVLGHVYHHLYNIDMIQLRFFTVYGPRQRPDLAIHKFTKLITEGKPIPFYGDGTTARDYTYIDDIVDGIIKSIDYIRNNTQVYEIINLGESEVITLTEMVKTLEEAIGRKAILDKMPMQAGDVNMTNADISKARQLIAYTPSTDFKSGIDKFVAWFKTER